MRRAILGTVVMTVLLAIYLALTLQLAIALLGSSSGVAIAMGVALVILPLVGVWALVRELMFGFSSSRLIRSLEAEGGLPVDNLPHRPSGRPVRAEADAEVGARGCDWVWPTTPAAIDVGRGPRYARPFV